MSLNVQRIRARERHLLRVDLTNSSTAAPLTGLTYASSGLVCHYIRDRDTSATAVSLVAGTLGTWTSGGFVEVDATNFPGLYEIGLPDAMVAEGVLSADLRLQGATNLQPFTLHVELIADSQKAVAAVVDGQGINQWPEYSGNPVLSPTGTDGLTAWGNVVYVGAGNWHMYYTYMVSGRYATGHATSADGLTWVKDAAHNPVLVKGTTGQWDDYYAVTCAAWHEASTFYIFYIGDHTGTNVATGYATSTDGYTFTKSASNPVLTGDAGHWDQTSAEVGSIIKIGSTYHMFYDSMNTYYPATAGNDFWRRRIGRATSTDLINWTKDPRNPIFDFPWAGRHDPTVWYYGGWYYLLCCHYTSETDYGDLELWRCRNITFYDDEWGGRERVGIIGRSKGPTSAWMCSDTDGPNMACTDITKTAFPGGEFKLYVDSVGPDGNDRMGILQIPTSADAVRRYIGDAAVANAVGARDTGNGITADMAAQAAWATGFGNYVLDPVTSTLTLSGASPIGTLKVFDVDDPVNPTVITARP